MCRWDGGGCGNTRNGRTSVQTYAKLFLKTLTEAAVTTDVESLLQYFTTFTENADLLLQRWLVPWGAL